MTAVVDRSGAEEHAGGGAHALAVAPAHPAEAEVATSFGDRRIDELEGLRGIASLLVVLYHMPPWNPLLSGIGLIRGSYLMVDLFFVLSGFVIYNAYADRIRSPRSLLRFQFLRFGRLYPVHLVVLLAFVGLEVAKYVAQASGSLTPNGIAFTVNGSRALVEQLFLVQAIGPTGNALSFNAPAWSISVEFYTYLVFGIVALCVRGAAKLVFPSIGIVALAVLATGAAEPFDLLVGCIAGFFVGCLAAQVGGFLGARYPDARIDARITTLALVSLFGFVAWQPSRSEEWLVSLLSLVLIVSIVHGDDGVVRRLLRSRALLWLGALSYAMYMVHTLVIFGARQAVRMVAHGPARTIDGIPVPLLSLGESLVANAGTLAVVVLASVVLHRTVEQPWRERSRRFATARAAASAS